MKGVLFCLLISLVWIGCSKPTAEEYFDQAQDAVTARQFEKAVGHFDQLIKDYPADPLAEDAMFIIATIVNNELHDYEQAVTAYKRYSRAYPEGKQAPVALFLTAYLYNNELHNMDSAAASYQLFLQRYPDHEMAQSAQFELDNLGLSPEELLASSNQQKGSDKPALTQKPAGR